MLVSEIMTNNVATCRADDSLADVARIMWERDCGVVPVVDEEDEPVGMITDRDICMATYFQGRSPHDISVQAAMSKTVTKCHDDDSIEAAESLMRRDRVRRLPVIDDEGVVIGILSIGDIALHLQQTPEIAIADVHEVVSPVHLESEGIARTLSAICAHPI